MIQFIQIAVSFVPLLSYLFSTFIKSYPMRSYQGFYLVLGGIAALLPIIGIVNTPWFYPIIILAAGEILHVIAGILFGTKISTHSYAVLLGCTGLTPFHTAPILCVIVFVSVALVVVIYSAWLSKHPKIIIQKHSKKPELTQGFGKEVRRLCSTKLGTITFANIPILLTFYGIFKIFVN